MNNAVGSKLEVDQHSSPGQTGIGRRTMSMATMRL